MPLPALLSARGAGRGYGGLRWPKLGLREGVRETEPSNVVLLLAVGVLLVAGESKDGDGWAATDVSHG